MQQLKIWIVIKQSTNLELNEPIGEVVMNVKRLTHSQQQMLGQHCSHATEQSHGQLLATAQHDQTQCPKPANKMIVKQDEQPQDAPNVHAVMVPMSQLVGGWHVTSMTKHPKEQNVPHPCPRLLGPTQ